MDTSLNEDFTGEPVPEFPKSVTRVSTGGKDVYLVGTAHVSKESVEDVRRTISVVRPDAVCVELCPARHSALVKKDAWRKMDIVKIVREKKAVFLLAQLVMTAFYRKLGEQLGIQPGAEMLEGVRLAEETGAELVLADRDIDVTLRRVWGFLSFWNKLKMLGHLVTSIFVSDAIEEDMIEEMKEQDQLEHILGEFAEHFPEVKRRLIDERDLYLAEKIRTAPGTTVVAVVGAAHVPGIVEHIGEPRDLEHLRELPKPSAWPSVVKWTIPALIVLLLVMGFFRGGVEHSIGSIYIWILVNGIFSAVGAALALAHPLTIIASFFAAPLTSLNPMIAAGWVSGLVQASVKKPTVADLENLPQAIGTVRGFWLNPVSRILLVVVLANLGSTIGTLVSGSWIAARTF